MARQEMLLHQLPVFAELLGQLAESLNIDPYLIEKDYWLMHCLWGLQQQGWVFELKGGTSLSKGHRIINRFSEDIDIRFEPPADLHLKTGKNHDKPSHVAARRDFFDWLASEISIPGLTDVNRALAYDDLAYRNGGISLIYPTVTQSLPAIKDGILLEVGFDVTAPNVGKTISSWAMDAALEAGLAVQDNRAKDVPCYAPGYTLVEKLQTISTKYRKQQATGEFGKNFLRHYYDIYCLLEQDEVQSFLSTPAYVQHKKNRFRSADNPDIASNEAFILSEPAVRALYEANYLETAPLYYKGQVPFGAILSRIAQYMDHL